MRGKRGPCPYGPPSPAPPLLRTGLAPSSPRFPLLRALVAFLPAPFPAPPAPPHRPRYAIPSTHPCGRHRPRSHAQRESGLDVEALPCPAPPSPDPVPSCPPLRTWTTDSALSDGGGLRPAVALLPAPPGPAHPRHPPPRRVGRRHGVGLDAAVTTEGGGLAAENKPVARTDTVTCECIAMLR